jgi:hypothetical protein
LRTITFPETLEKRAGAAIGRLAQARAGNAHAGGTNRRLDSEMRKN